MFQNEICNSKKNYMDLSFTVCYLSMFPIGETFKGIYTHMHTHTRTHTKKKKPQNFLDNEIENLRWIVLTCKNSTYDFSLKDCIGYFFLYPAAFRKKSRQLKRP